MYNRLIEFVQKNDIIYSCQFGFRKTHSTSLASIHLINNIASAIDRHETTAGVFLDLSKAFDTTDHQILFGKLEHYGICGWAWLGLEVIFLAANNLFNLIVHVPLSRLFYPIILSVGIL